MRRFEEAIILAAGRGTRLGDAARGGPKCLVDVGGRSILEHQLRALNEAGVRRFVIVTGFEAEQVKAAAREILPSVDIAFVYNPEFASTNVLSSWILGAAELRADHVYAHGDTVFAQELLRRLWTQRPEPILFTMDGHECDEEAMKIRVESDAVVEISKSMPNDAASGEFTGVMGVAGSVLPKLRKTAERLLDTPEGATLFMEAALQDLIDAGHGSLMGVVDVSGVPWREIDFIDDLEAAREAFSDLE